MSAENIINRGNLNYASLIADYFYSTGRYTIRLLLQEVKFHPYSFLFLSLWPFFFMYPSKKKLYKIEESENKKILNTIAKADEITDFYIKDKAKKINLEQKHIDYLKKNAFNLEKTFFEIIENDKLNEKLITDPKLYYIIENFLEKKEIKLMVKLKKNYIKTLKKNNKIDLVKLQKITLENLWNSLKIYDDYKKQSYKKKIEKKLNKKSKAFNEKKILNKLDEYSYSIGYTDNLYKKKIFLLYAQSFFPKTTSDIPILGFKNVEKKELEQFMDLLLNRTKTELEKLEDNLNLNKKTSKNAKELIHILSRYIKKHENAMNDFIDFSGYYKWSKLLIEFKEYWTKELKNSDLKNLWTKIKHNDIENIIVDSGVFIDEIVYWNWTRFVNRKFWKDADEEFDWSEEIEKSTVNAMLTNPFLNKLKEKDKYKKVIKYSPLHFWAEFNRLKKTYWYYNWLKWSSFYLFLYVLMYMPGYYVAHPLFLLFPFWIAICLYLIDTFFVKRALRGIKDPYLYYYKRDWVVTAEEILEKKRKKNSKNLPITLYKKNTDMINKHWFYYILITYPWAYAIIWLAIWATFQWNISWFYYREEQRKVYENWEDAKQKGKTDDISEYVNSQYERAWSGLTEQVIAYKNYFELKKSVKNLEDLETIREKILKKPIEQHNSLVDYVKKGNKITMEFDYWNATDFDYFMFSYTNKKMLKIIIAQEQKFIENCKNDLIDEFIFLELELNNMEIFFESFFRNIKSYFHDDWNWYMIKKIHTAKDPINRYINRDSYVQKYLINKLDGKYKLAKKHEILEFDYKDMRESITKVFNESFTSYYFVRHLMTRLYEKAHFYRFFTKKMYIILEHFWKKKWEILEYFWKNKWEILNETWITVSSEFSSFVEFISKFF